MSSQEGPYIDGTYYTTTRAPITKVYFDKDTDITIITPSETCIFYQTNSPELCAKEFILKTLPSGKLSAISEVESIGLLTTAADNYWSALFEIYVRWILNSINEKLINKK